MNIFKHEPDKLIMAITTEGLHLSGDLMKAIDFRQPRVIEKLKAMQSSKVGTTILIDGYLFIVGRKHYNSKFDLKKIDEIITEVKEKYSNTILKITMEDFPEVMQKFAEQLENIEICDTSKWEY